MGNIPEMKTKPVVKAKLGDLRQMVLPGGGDVGTRVWASMKVKTESLLKWMNKGAFRTSAANDAINKLEDFMDGEGQLFEHPWKMLIRNVPLELKPKSFFSLTRSKRKSCTTRQTLRSSWKT